MIYALIIQNYFYFILSVYIVIWEGLTGKTVGVDNK